MSLIKSLRKVAGIFSLAVVLGGATGLITYSVLEQEDETQNDPQRKSRIEENMINNPRVPLDTPEEYIEPIKEAIKSGRVQPGAIVRALNKERTRIREFKYDGRERGYGFSFVREYDFDANDANNQSQ